jgi:hypothetical protein
MMIFFKYCILIVSILVLPGMAAFAQELVSGERITQINVNCDYTVQVPDAVKARLEKTLDQTLRRILIEKDDSTIENYGNVKDSIESSIIEGLNIAFEPKGYMVESLDLTFGNTTDADFVVRPYKRYVKDVSIILDTANFHPFWQDLFNRRFNDISDRYMEACNPLLIGLPVDAEDQDWAFNLVKDDVQSISILSDSFHDMMVEESFDIEETATLSIAMTPKTPVIKTLRVRAYSQSMFQLVLDPIKELVSSQSNIIVGMPLSWLESSHSDIEKEFCRIIENDSISRKFSLETTCRLYFQEKYPDSAFIEIKTESTKWFVGAKAMVDVGNNQTPDEFEAHLGMMLGRSFELFTQLNFFPDDVRFRTDIGAGLHLLPGNYIGGGWDINESGGKMFFHQYITRDMRIEAEIFSEDKDQDQYGFVYKPFQFVSFGIFSDGDDDYWLRAAFAF